MGFGNVSDKVIPKVGLLSLAERDGDIASRYFTPRNLHASHAVTGACCVAAAAAVDGTIANQMAVPSSANIREFVIEHPAGQLKVRLETAGNGLETEVVSAGVMRTARLIMRGDLMIPV